MDNFPNQVNDVYGIIETLAAQNIRAVKSTNTIDDGFYEYAVENGKVIEEAVIKMAQAQALDKSTPVLTPVDPTVYAQYFNNFVAHQYVTTIRRDDIRAIIANKGVGVEDVVASILDSLTQGEGAQDFNDARNCLYGAGFKNYRAILGGVPKSAKAIIYALREMYLHVKYNNDDLTGQQFVSSCPDDDIRIAISPEVLNILDVKELVSAFQIEREQLFGKIVVVPTTDLTDDKKKYFAFVYDRKALGRATRTFDFTQDVLGGTRYTKHYLTTERAYFYNPLFKGCYLDCSEAVATEKATLVGNPSTSYTITKTLSNATTTSTVTSVYQHEPYAAEFTASSGYTLVGSTYSVTMGGTDITASVAALSADNSKLIVNIPYVSGNVVVAVTAVSA